VADFAVTLLPLSVLLPSAMHLVNSGGAHHLEPVVGSESLARVLLFGGRSQLSSCHVQLLSASESSPAFAPRALLMGGAGAVAAANLSLAPRGLSIAATGGSRGGGASATAPSPPGIAQKLGGILLLELGAAAGNRAVIGRGQFCSRACTEVATYLLARGLLPAGEASLRRHLPALVALLSLAPGVHPPMLPAPPLASGAPSPWLAFCCFRPGCAHLGCRLATPLLRGFPDGIARLSARKQARNHVDASLAAASPPPPDPPIPPAADCVDGGLSLDDLADGDALHGLHGVGGDEVLPPDDDMMGGEGSGDGPLGGGGSDSGDPPGERGERGAGPPPRKRGPAATTGPAVAFGCGAPRCLPPDVVEHVPMVGGSPRRVDLGAISSVRPVPWSQWPSPGGAASGSRKRCITPTGSGARQSAVAGETAAGEVCASAAMCRAVKSCGGWDVELQFFEVVGSALGHRNELACSLVSISFFLRRLAVAGLLHKCDAEGRRVVFTFFG